MQVVNEYLQFYPCMELCYSKAAIRIIVLVDPTMRKAVMNWFVGPACFLKYWAEGLEAIWACLTTVD